MQYDVIKMENQSPDSNVSPTSPVQIFNTVPQSYSTPTLNGNNNNGTSKPYIKIVEQPAKKDQRFRYVVEGRSAGSIKGANWTADRNTFPTIEIANLNAANKKVIVIVSTVTQDLPYRPHPHKVVGREGGGQKYKDGICEVTLTEAPYRTSFSNLGIQCTKKKDWEKALKERRDKNINPFNTPYTTEQKLDYELHVVRLCFQAFVENVENENGKKWISLDPVVSDPIIDKKAASELVICSMCSCSANVNGGDHLILLCEKVDKNDIKVKFTEFDSQGTSRWHAYAEIQPQDIHKNTAIRFKTPRYERTDIANAVKVYIQLERPSDKETSKALEFEFRPDPDSFKRKRLRSSQDVRHFMETHNKMSKNSDDQFQACAANFINNFGATASNFNINTDLKVEQTSPDYYGNQNSPFNMVPSPLPNSPLGAGMHYTTLTPSHNNNTNPFLEPNTIPLPSLVSQLPSMTGGAFTPLETVESNPTPFNMPPAEPIDSSEMTSEGRLVNRLANQLEAEANAVSNNNNNFFFNIFDTTAQYEIITEEEGLTASGLINELNNADLLQMANLSVSGNT